MERITIIIYFYLYLIVLSYLYLTFISLLIYLLFLLVYFYSYFFFPTPPLLPLRGRRQMVESNGAMGKAGVSLPAHFPYPMYLCHPNSYSLFIRQTCPPTPHIPYLLVLLLFLLLSYSSDMFAATFQTRADVTLRCEVVFWYMAVCVCVCVC